jgi:hypothetical protein
MSMLKIHPTLKEEVYKHYSFPRKDIPLFKVASKYSRVKYKVKPHSVVIPKIKGLL